MATGTKHGLDVRSLVTVQCGNSVDLWRPG